MMWAETVFPILVTLVGVFVALVVLFALFDWLVF